MRKDELSKLKAERDAAIVTDYADGQSLRQIATKIGCSQPTVRNVLLRQGVQLRRPVAGGGGMGRDRGVVTRYRASRKQQRAVREARRADILARHQAGQKQLHIARVLHVAPETIRGILRRAGVTPNPKLSELAKRRVAERRAAQAVAS